MKNERLRPFWINSEGEEMKGLWDLGCFRKWKRSDLLSNDSVFTAHFHYNIKRDGKTGLISKCKV